MHTKPRSDRDAVSLTLCIACPSWSPLHLSQDGKIKILQVVDYSVARMDCQETDLFPPHASNNLTNCFLDRVLDAENDIFTGNQLNEETTLWNPKSVLVKFAVEVMDRQIPWAAVFGNCDNEMGEVWVEQLGMMQALSYLLIQPGPRVYMV